MARKRKVEKIADKPPEFDAADFLRKEISDAKLTFVTFLVALAFTGLSLAIYHAGSPGLAILVGFAGLPALPFLHGLMGMSLDRLFPLKEGKRDEEEVKAEKRGRSMRMVGQWFTFFFTWLAIFVVALNPPFADVSGPAMVGVKAEAGGQSYPLEGGDPPTIKVNRSGVVTVTIILSDPAGIKAGSVVFIDKTNPKEHPMTAGAVSGETQEFTYQATLGPQGDGIRFSIYAEDLQGRSSTSSDFKLLRV